MQVKRFVAGLAVAILVCLAALSIFSGNLKAKGAGDAPWGFSMSNLDTTCKPCDDFYEFAMGGWMKANPIPGEYSSWGTFTELRDKNLTAMRTILEAASAAVSSSSGVASGKAAASNEQKIGMYYASCMDTTMIEAAGLRPISKELAAIDAVNDRKSLDAVIA